MITSLFITAISTIMPADTPLSLLGRHDLTCPVCTQTFTTVICTQSNTRGGVDRDLLARALGPEPEYYRISTCPRCGYSGYLSDFAAGIVLPPDFCGKVLKSPRLALPEGFTPGSDPRELDAKVRYALAIQCYRWAQRSDEAMAWLCLRASWIARDEGSILPKDDRLARVMKYIERWRPTMRPEDNQASIEMQLATRVAEALAAGTFNRYQQPYVELALALILRRHGETRQVGPILDRLKKHSFDSALAAGVSRMRESIRTEADYQREAATCFERALLAGQIAAENRGAARYVLGELCRRLGRDHEAASWYAESLKDAHMAADLRIWAVEQQRWLRDTRPVAKRD